MPDPQTAPALRWGIIAPGGIAHNFAEAVARFTKSSVVAVGSSSAERAADFAAKFSIPRSYASYDELVADPQVEAVYVASPHSHHRAQALLAIEAGKHVLVEKALAVNGAEVAEIFAAAGAAKVFAMEAMWTRHLPHVIELHRLIDSGALGELINVSADHGQYFDVEPSHRLLNPDLAGGALLDLGVYPLAFILDFLGAPRSVIASGEPTATGVDGQLSAVLDYPGRAQGVASSTLWARTPTTASLSGTEARAEVAGPFFTPTTFTLTARDGRRVAEFDGRVDNGFQFQIAEVARCVAEGRRESERMSWQHSVELMAVMDDVRSALAA